MKKLIMIVTMTLMSLNAFANFDINKLMIAGFHIQNQLPTEYAAESSDVNYDKKHDIYSIDVVENVKNGELLATVFVRVDDEGNITELAAKNVEVPFLESIGISIDYGFTPKAKGFLADWAKNGFKSANERANKIHIEKILTMKPYTIFAGDVYIKAGESTVSVPMSKLTDKTDAQVRQAIEDAVFSEMSGADISNLSSKVQMELRAAAEDVARQAKDATQEVVKLLNQSDFHKKVEQKVKSDCDAIDGTFSVLGEGAWMCVGN